MLTERDWMHMHQAVMTEYRFRCQSMQVLGRLIGGNVAVLLVGRTLTNCVGGLGYKSQQGFKNPKNYRGDAPIYHTPFYVLVQCIGSFLINYMYMKVCCHQSRSMLQLIKKNQGMYSANHLICCKLMIILVIFSIL